MVNFMIGTLAPICARKSSKIESTPCLSLRLSLDLAERAVGFLK